MRRFILTMVAIVLLVATPHAQTQSLVHLDGWRAYVPDAITIQGWTFSCDVAIVDAHLVVDGYRIAYADARVTSFFIQRPDVRAHYESIGYCSHVSMYSGLMFGLNRYEWLGSHTLQYYIKDSLGREYYSNAISATF